MKKLLFTLVLFVTVSFGIKTTVAQSFNSGLILGPTFCQVDGDHYAGYHQLGFTAGAYVNLPLDDHLSAQMELKYSLLGAHSSNKEVMEYYYNPYSLRLHYAEIPLMLQGNFGIFTIEGGASIDVLLKATEDVNADFQVTTRRWRSLSATGNIGVHFVLTDHIGIGARFMYSVVPCRFTGNPGWFYNQYYNKAIQITLTYNINSPLR
jgi:hypothetical protein